MFRLILICTLFIIISCAKNSDKKFEQQNQKENIVRYAQEFEIRQYADYIQVYIKQKSLKAPRGKFYWLAKQKPSYSIPDSVHFIQIPIQKIICTSTTHIPHLTYLGCTDALVGFPITDYISSEPMRERINKGLVTDLGQETNLNIEKIIQLKPDVLMTYALNKNASPEDLLTQFNIPVILNADYLEQHPLGRAEWIKLSGALFDKMNLADSIFRDIEQKYLRLKSLVDTINLKPKVFSGVLYGDSWFLPGGKNYAAVLLKDAGLQYAWETDSTSGFLQLPFETVLNQARDAKLWIGTASFTSFATLSKSDNRYNLFDAYQTKNIYHYNAKLGEKGGSFYLEEGYLRPDLILADLIKIAHPDKIQNHNFVYHARLAE